MAGIKMSSDDEEKLFKCCGSGFFLLIIGALLLILFAGMMSGLTLAYMSISVVDLEVLAKSSSSKSRIYASRIMSLVKRRHLLLCTLLICYGAAMETLPLLIRHLVSYDSSILISATLVLLFSEVIPHAICSRHGLVIGAAMAPAIHLLLVICFPAAYPISKLLDLLLGKGRAALYRRAELKTLVDLHEAGKGGDLSCHEISIIKGALDLTEKTARDAMTPIADTFFIDINAKLTKDLINLILEKGHSRVPVYHEHPTNIVGLVLVKNLITIKPQDEVPMKNITIRSIPRISEAMPLWDILNEFQRGHSHMALVITHRRSTRAGQMLASEEEVRVNVFGESHSWKRSQKSKRSLRTLQGLSSSSSVSRRGSSKSRRWSGESHPEIVSINANLLRKQNEHEEVIGIITMEDVIEELLMEDIYDEMDHKGSSRASLDVHKGIMRTGSSMESLNLHKGIIRTGSSRASSFDLHKGGVRPFELNDHTIW